MIEFELSGKIKYKGSWAWLECPKDVGDYYLNVIKWIWGVKISPPINGPHITLVAGKYESPKYPNIWGALEGQSLSFKYSGIIHEDSYWWLRIIEDSALRKFRKDLGLPEQLKYPFHLTIGKENA